MSNAIDHTPRGFGIYADFTDKYGSGFTVQESSLATEKCVWVGKEGERGHLTVEMAQQVRDALTGWLHDVGAEFDRAIAKVKAEALRDAAAAFDAAAISVEIFGDPAEAQAWRRANETRANLAQSLRARATRIESEAGES